MTVVLSTGVLGMTTSTIPCTALSDDNLGIDRRKDKMEASICAVACLQIAMNCNARLTRPHHLHGSTMLVHVCTTPLKVSSFRTKLSCATNDT